MERRSPCQIARSHRLWFQASYCTTPKTSRLAIDVFVASRLAFSLVWMFMLRHFKELPGAEECGLNDRRPLEGCHCEAFGQLNRA